MEEYSEGSTTIKEKRGFDLIWRGLFMGIAEVIPGVSGGTLAFITGIYERLLNAIKSFDLEFIRLLFRGKLKAALRKIDFSFLAFLLIGMLIGIVVGIFGVTYFLEHYPEVLWALFFGCILASIPYIFSQISSITIKSILAFLIAALGAGFICMQQPVLGSENPLYIIMAGAIAISALMLPGVSGSFMLVLLGLYTTIIPSLKQFLTTFDFSYFSIVAYFGVGCIVGLLIFSRLLSYVYEHHRDTTLAILSGFMLGSIVKVWPWREPTQVLDKTNQLIRAIRPDELDRSLFHSETLKIATESLTMPGSYFTNPYTLGCSIAMIVGAMGVLLLWKYQK